MEPQPPEYMMDIPGMQDEMRRPMMLIVSANKKVNEETVRKYIQEQEENDKLEDGRK